MTKPSVFIGSSKEGLRIAETIRSLLKKDASITLWSKGVFELSKTAIESLVDVIDKVDFAILLLTGDDVTVSRKQQHTAPRDNVLFELGLFIGRIGRDRCYFVFDSAKNLKLPSDLLGVTAATYKSNTAKDWKLALGPACDQIRKQISKLGRRARMDADTTATYQAVRSFCDRISGYWWERIKQDETSALSFVSVTLDPSTVALRMTGRAYDRNGTHVANWKTIASCVNLEEQKVFYWWEGWHPSRPAEPYEGVGEIDYQGTEAVIESGTGVFSDINVTDLKSIVKKSFEFHRCAEQEVKIMQGDNGKRIVALVQEKLMEMR